MVAKVKKSKVSAEETAAPESSTSTSTSASKRVLSSKVYTVSYGGADFLVRATTPAQAVAKFKRRIEKPSIDVRLTTGEELFAAGRAGLTILDDAEPEDNSQTEMELVGAVPAQDAAADGDDLPFG